MCKKLWTSALTIQMFPRSRPSTRSRANCERRTSGQKQMTATRTTIMMISCARVTAYDPGFALGNARVLIDLHAAVQEGKDHEDGGRVAQVRAVGVRELCCARAGARLERATPTGAPAPRSTARTAECRECRHHRRRRARRRTGAPGRRVVVTTSATKAGAAISRHRRRAD